MPKRKQTNHLESQNKKQKTEIKIFDGKVFYVSKSLSVRVHIIDLIKQHGGIVLEQIKRSFGQTVFFICDTEEFDSLSDEVRQALDKRLRIFPKELITKSIHEEKFLDTLEMKNVVYGSRFKIFASDEDKLKITKLIEKFGGEIHTEGKICGVTTKEYLRHPRKEFYFGVVRKEMTCLLYEKLENLLKERKQIDYNEPPVYQGLDINWYEFEQFENYEKRKKLRHIIDEFEEIKCEGTEFPKIVNDVTLIILSFLPIKDLMKMRLLSKNFNALSLDSNIWKKICEDAQYEYNWLPKMDIEEVNPNYHWFHFYRKFLHPLIMDYKDLKNEALKLTKNEGSVFNDQTTAIRIGAFFDTRRVIPGSLPIGKSKMAGDPDLPDEIIIPKNYAFVCQLNLSELAKDFGFSRFQIPFNENNRLPKEGMLYFFSDTECWCGKVFYYNGDLSKLKRRKLPEEAYELSFTNLHECEIKMTEALTINRYNTDNIIHNYKLDTWSWWKNSFKKYYEGPYHCLFGFEDYIQRLLTDKNSFLFFQVDCDPSTGFCFGDMGCLYYMFDKSITFKEGEINVKMQMQCG